jgi:hypothetical protein
VSYLLEIIIICIFFGYKPEIFRSFKYGDMTGITPGYIGDISGISIIKPPFQAILHLSTKSLAEPYLACAPCKMK